MRLIRNVMLSILLASSGLAAVEGGKSPLCDVDWIGAASLGQIAEQLEAGTMCPPGMNPLILALSSEVGIDKIRLMVANDEVANVSGTWEKVSPLHVAASYRSLEVVKLLTDRGYDIHARSSSGREPLHSASESTPDAKVIDFLVENGAELNARDDLGMAPFHIAMLYNPNMEVTKALYKPEFLEESVSDTGLTMLFFLALYGRAEKVEFMIDKGAEINPLEIIDSTPLHFAVFGSASSDPDLGGEHLSIVKILLDNGANVSIKDDISSTALQNAFLGIDRPQPDMAVVSALLNHGADPADINDVPCFALINDADYKFPENLNAVLEERGLPKIEPNNTDDLSCYKKRVLAFIRPITIHF